MTKRRAYIFSGIITIIFVALGNFIAVNLPQSPLNNNQVIAAPNFYQVVRAVDGDTIVVDMENKQETVRLIGVDTPETHRPNSPVQCFGGQASDFTAQSVNGKKVRLEADPTNDNRDRYGRLLRYVYLPDGSLLDKTLIEQGYGFAYLNFPFQKKDEFAEAQAKAEAAKAGLWSACQPHQESNGRWQTQNLP